MLGITNAFNYCQLIQQLFFIQVLLDYFNLILYIFLVDCKFFTEVISLYGSCPYYFLSVDLLFFGFSDEDSQHLFYCLFFGVVSQLFNLLSLKCVNVGSLGDLQVYFHLLVLIVLNLDQVSHLVNCKRFFIHLHNAIVLEITGSGVTHFISEFCISHTYHPVEIIIFNY